MSDTYLEALLRDGESATVEFKSDVGDLDGIGRAACSLLNARGGIIIVGVDDRGQATGILDAQAKSKAIQRHLFQFLSPKAPCSVTTDESLGKVVLVVDAPAGQEQPYVYRGHIYMREGPHTRPARPNEISHLVEARASHETRWERCPAPGVELSDLQGDLILDTASFARKRGLTLENTNDPTEVLRQLGLATPGSLFNSAVVLFAKQPHRFFPQTRVRAVVYDRDKSGNFTDRRDFEGNLFTLIEAVEAFVKTHVPISAKFTPGQLRREDSPAYPFSALREGLLNALVHRDYSTFTGGVSVSIYPSRIEIWNSGWLPTGLTIGDLKRDHPSLPHNPDISQVVYLRGLIERVGRGTENIIEECRTAGLPAPVWKQTPAGITLTFFAREAGASLVLNSRQQELMARLRVDEVLRPAAYYQQVAPSTSQRRAQLDLVELAKAGYFMQQGKTKGTVYVRTSKPWPADS